MQSDMLRRFGIPQLSQEQMVIEIADRVHCAKLWCLHYYHLLDSRHLDYKFKFQLYIFFVLPILTYGCEVWALDNDNSRKLLRFEISILKKIYKTKYPRRLVKRLRPDLTTIYRKYRAANVVDHVTKERLRWTDLIQCEKRALKRLRKEPFEDRRIQWWDS